MRAAQQQLESFYPARWVSRSLCPILGLVWNQIDLSLLPYPCFHCGLLTALFFTSDTVDVIKEGSQFNNICMLHVRVPTVPSLCFLSVLLFLSGGNVCMIWLFDIICGC